MPEPQGAPAYLSQSSWKSLESEATSKQSDDSAYVSHKGHRKLSPSAASTVHGYMAHSQTKYGAKRGASQDTELTSLAMPDVYVPPPLPSNEEARQATVDALGIIHAPANVHLYSLCRLVRLQLAMVVHCKDPAGLPRLLAPVHKAGASRASASLSA